MPNIYASHFEYNNVSSRAYGLIIATVETTRFTQLQGTVSGVTVFNRSNKKAYLVDDDYTNSPVSFEVEFVTDSGDPISYEDRREVEKWLFNRSQYHRFYLDVQDDKDGETYEIVNGQYRRYYLNCRFVNARRLDSEGIYGYVATLEADSGFWWQDATVEIIDLSSSPARVKFVDVPLDTDIDDYVYPIVEIKVGSGGGTIAMRNMGEMDRPTKLDNVDPFATITLNGNLNRMTGTAYTNMRGAIFPRLMDGNNHIRVSGDIKEMKFSYNNRRFL